MYLSHPINLLYFQNRYEERKINVMIDPVFWDEVSEQEQARFEVL